MPDLNTRIANWRAELAEGGECSERDIDELESHLREEFDHLVSTGLTEEESFLVARHRLGDSDSLVREFAKVNAVAVWSYRLFWMAAGILVMTTLGYVSYAMSELTVVIGQRTGLVGRALGLLSIGTYVLGTALGIIVCYRVCSGGHRGIRDWLQNRWKTPASRIRFTILCVIPLCLLGMASMYIVRLVASPVDMQDYGYITLLKSYFYLGWAVLWIVLLPALMVILYPRMRRPSVT